MPLLVFSLSFTCYLDLHGAQLLSVGIARINTILGTHVADAPLVAIQSRFLFMKL